MTSASRPVCLVALLAGIAVPAPVGAGDKSWVGQTILVKNAEVTLVRHKEGGKGTFEEALTGISYRVLHEDGSWVRVRQRGAEGWLLKSRAVLLDEAVDYFTARLAQDKTEDWLYAYRGWAWKLRGNLERAHKDYDEAIRLNAGNPAWWYNRGQIRHDKKELDEAIADYDEAIRLDRKGAGPYLDRGLAWDQKKEHDTAIKDYDEAIRLDPPWALAFNNRGWAWQQQKELGRAMRDYDEAIRLDPQLALAFANRGWAWSQNKEFGRAIKDYEEAVRIEPGNAPAGNNLAWLLATCPQAQYRNGPRAMTVARKLCAAGGWKTPQHMATLAAAAAETGDFEAAVKWQTKALGFSAYAQDQGEWGRKLLRLYEGRKPFHEE